MALVPIISQTWDTTSVFNPTRMNNIEQNLAIVSDATGVKYSNGVSVKDKIDSLANDVVTVNGNTAYINGTDKSITYVIIGKLVVFSGRFSVTTEKPSGQGNYLFKDLPTPRSIVSVCENTRDDIILNGGYITSNNAIPVGNYNVFCAYICY